MLQILIGGLSGIFSGIGMGGGTILIFLLTTFAGLEQHIAQATNLIYFIPTAISAIIVNYRNKNINAKLAIYVSLCGIIGAIIGSIISAGLVIAYNETMGQDKKKVMKQGKKMIKKLGII